MAGQSGRQEGCTSSQPDQELETLRNPGKLHSQVRFGKFWDTASGRSTGVDQICNSHRSPQKYTWSHHTQHQGPLFGSPEKIA